VKWEQLFNDTIHGVAESVLIKEEKKKGKMDYTQHLEDN